MPWLSARSGNPLSPRGSAGAMAETYWEPYSRPVINQGLLQLLWMGLILVGLVCAGFGAFGLSRWRSEVRGLERMSSLQLLVGFAFVAILAWGLWTALATAFVVAIALRQNLA